MALAASAGGLNALTHVLAGLPHELPAALVAHGADEGDPIREAALEGVELTTDAIRQQASS